MTPAELIRLMIAQNEEKLDETITGLQSGPVKDAVRLIVPMFKDQHRIMDAILEVAEEKR